MYISTNPFLFYSLISLCAHTHRLHTHSYAHTHVHTCIRILNQTTKQLNKLNNAFEKIRKNNKLDKCFFNIQHRNICNVFPNEFIVLIPLPLSLLVHIYIWKTKPKCYISMLSTYKFGLSVCFAPQIIWINYPNPTSTRIETWTRFGNLFIYFVLFFVNTL